MPSQALDGRMVSETIENVPEILRTDGVVTHGVLVVPPLADLPLVLLVDKFPASHHLLPDLLHELLLEGKEALMKESQHHSVHQKGSVYSLLLYQNVWIK